MSKRLPFLDAGRGLAAIIVLVHHVIALNGPAVEVLVDRNGTALKLINTLSNLNFEAVLFFFFISGWSIYLSFQSISQTTVNALWRTYFLHRARRILPLFVLSLTTAYILTAGLSGHPKERETMTLIGNLLFLQTAPNMEGTAIVPFAGNGPLWSLSYEVWYYITLPAVVLFAASLPRRLQYTEIGLVAAIPVGIIAIGINSVVPNPFLMFLTLWPIWMSGFLCGKITSECRREWTHLLLLALSVAALSVLSDVINSSTLIALQRGLLVGTIVLALVLISRQRFISELLESGSVRGLSSPLAYAGLGSYAVYIFHYPMLKLLAAYGADLGTVVVLCAGLVIFAPQIEMSLQRQVNRLTASLVPTAR